MFEVTMKRKIQLDPQQAEDLIVQVLQKDFEFLCKEINELRHKRDLKSYEAADLGNNIEMRDAIQKIIRYYSTSSDYDNFMELQRVYGNV